MNEKILLIVLLVSLVALQAFWLFTDPRPWRKRVEKVYIIVGAVVVLQLLASLFLPWPFRQWNNFFTLIGIVLFILGIAWSIWAKITMYKHWGPPGAHDSKKQKKLLIHGPFAYSRNPIYLGILVVDLGFSLTIKSLFIFLILVLFMYFYTAIRREEALLAKYFGKTYLLYKKKVSRFLGII